MDAPFARHRGEWSDFVAADALAHRSDGNHCIDPDAIIHRPLFNGLCNSFVQISDYPSLDTSLPDRAHCIEMSVQIDCN